MNVDELVLNSLEKGCARLQERYPALGESLNYVLLNEGKRLRAKFCAEVGLSLGVPERLLETPLFLLEATHNGSLVQDDLPLLDNDDLRRGKPSCHVAFSESEAMLLGDILLGNSAQLLLEDSFYPADLRVELAGRFLRVAGDICYGQHLEQKLLGRPNISKDELLQVAALKTAPLFQASFSIPGLLAEDVELGLTEKLARFGYCYGMLFQIADDVSDARADEGAKNIASVLDKGALMQLTDQFYEEAEDILAQLSGLSFLEQQLMSVRDSVFAG